MFSDDISMSYISENKTISNDNFQLSQKILFEKYNSNDFSIQNIFINYLIFNCRCRLTLFFKEFLIFGRDNEFLRHFYTTKETNNILKKILEIYCLYSKIYPNYIILKENKFLYKNIRKKQKMIDENNNKLERKKNLNINNDNVNNNKENELFTLSVRNEIKEFQENSYYNKNSKDNIYNQYNQKKPLKTRKINENWVLINNSHHNHLKDDNSKKENNTHYIKNFSFDSFWTNDTNNLSLLLNAINDKFDLDEIPKRKNKTKSRKKNLGYHYINNKMSQNKNQRKEENISSVKKKAIKKGIYKRIDNKKIFNEKSRNNFMKGKNKKTYVNQINNVNNNINKPISASLSNSKNMKQGLINKSGKIYNYLLTDKNLKKDIYKNLNQYYSIERDNSNNILFNNSRKLIPPILKKRKFYSKDFSKEKDNQLLKKLNENNSIKKPKKTKTNVKYAKKKILSNEFTKNYLDETKKNYSKDKFTNNEISRTLFSSNNNINFIRNKKILLKKFLTNETLSNKINNNQIYINNLTESYSQSIIKAKKKLNSSCIDDKNNIKGKTLNICHTSSNYCNIKSKINKYNLKKNSIKKQKTDGNLEGVKDKILGGKMGIKFRKNDFSPPSKNIIRRYSLTKSSHIKKMKKINSKKNIDLIDRQIVNNEMKNKLTDIKKNIRNQIIKSDNYFKNNESYNYKSLNKIKNENNFLIMDISQKENNSINSNKLINIENRNNRKVNLRKNFSPTLTYYHLYKSGNNKTKSHYNLINNSDFIEFHHENLFVKKNNNFYYNNDIINNKLDNNIYINNNRKNLKEKIHKSKTEYVNFLTKNKNINKSNNINKSDINKNFILKRFKKKNTNFYIFSKDKIKNNNLLISNENTIQRFNNISSSIIYNNSNYNYNEYTINKNINNSLSNSVNNIKEFQTPLVHRKRLKLIKKFIYQEEREKQEQPFSINNNISSNVAIKVNRSKFYEKVKEKMKNKINLNQI